MKWRVINGAIKFQSTPPLRGATALQPRLQAQGSPFQSTHPLRGATQFGVDLEAVSRFQSTHPLRGATLNSANPDFDEIVSIHAPPARCDLIAEASIIYDFMFQSTHPLRGATYMCDKRRCYCIRFNPRTPCEVRRNLQKFKPILAVFQSTHPLRGATEIICMN